MIAKKNGNLETLPFLDKNNSRIFEGRINFSHIHIC